LGEKFELRSGGPKEPINEDPRFAFYERSVWRDRHEYGLIAAGISVAIIAVVNGLGTKLNGTFSSISSQLK
jgi:Flp/Fap pilin component